MSISYIFVVQRGSNICELEKAPSSIQLLPPMAGTYIYTDTCPIKNYRISKSSHFFQVELIIAQIKCTIKGLHLSLEVFVTALKAFLMHTRKVKLL